MESGGELMVVDCRRREDECSGGGVVGQYDKVESESEKRAWKMREKKKTERN